jgi:D-lactate dehydrogenase
VLLVAGAAWKQWAILDDGRRIRLQPGVIGGQANRYLAPYGRKIGPDPASINAAMIGGIAANNASGMCCGTAQNSYRTVAALRVIFGDGTLLDTADAESREAFRRTHGRLLEELSALARATREDRALAERIRRKFAIKNTTGYSLNALVDFTEPFAILTHLLIGSEGTLAFLASVTYDTVPEHPHKASSLMIFPEIATACRAIPALREAGVAAAELMDRASLRSVEAKPGMPDFLATLPEPACALLVETRAGTPEALAAGIRAIQQALANLPTLRPLEFTSLPAEFNRLWNIRKGLFPAVGAVRRTGTTVVIEDVAFPVPRLAEATLELRALLDAHGYPGAIIFGHALEGNLHFVFTQDFNQAAEVQRYARFMDALTRMVVERYDGSLKAEHGTGRNMAPFVALEWGAAAYGLMRQVKKIFDPRNLLNPGVILNENPCAHLEHLKPLPATHPLVDKCIECGFCEAVCPSRNLTFTPRQRIVARREISRLADLGIDADRRQRLEADYVYPGERTCAADGLCAIACPVDIDTGRLTKALREIAARKPHVQAAARWSAAHFQTVTGLVRLGLGTADTLHRFLGPAAGDPDQRPLHAVTRSVLAKAGYATILPPRLEGLCCGLPFESKGLSAAADAKARELEAALLTASRGGELPVLCDTSPCLLRMRQSLSPWLRLYEPVEFVHDFLLERLALAPIPAAVALHVTCSALKLGLDAKFLALARACAREVVVPDQVGCCAFAGDRGFSVPELNASALAELAPAVAGRCREGFSNSRTCEIGLSLHSGIHYRSILYLVDRCSRAAAG